MRQRVAFCILNDLSHFLAYLLKQEPVNMFWKPSALIVSIGICGIVEAGPVSTSQGFPFATMNIEGSVLASGDIKTWIKWGSSRDDSPPSRYSATFLRKKERQDPEQPERFTGGIASYDAVQGQPDRIAAIACSEVDTQIFIPKRNQSFPSGEWISWDTSRTELRYCAMLPSSTFAVLYPNPRKLIIQQTHDKAEFDISHLKGRQLEFIAGKELFIVLSDAGLALVRSLLHIQELGTSSCHF